MHSRMIAWAARARATWFPERQVFIRCDGIVRYFVLSRRRQWQAAAAAGVLAVWLVAASVTALVQWLVVDTDARLAAAVAEVRREAAETGRNLRQTTAMLQAERDRLSGQLSAAQERAGAVAEAAAAERRRSERLQADARAQTARAEALSRRLVASQQSLDQVRREVGTLEASRSAAETEATGLRRALADARSGLKAAQMRLADAAHQHRLAQSRLREQQVAAESRAALALTAARAQQEALARERAAGAAAAARAASALAEAGEASRRAARAETRLAHADRETERLQAGLHDVNQHLRTLLGVALPERPEVVSGDLAGLRGSVSALIVQRRSEREAAAQLVDQLRALRADLDTEQHSRDAAEEELFDARRRLAATLVERDQARRAARTAASRLQEVETALAASARRHGDLQSTLDETRTLVEQVRDERDRAHGRADRLGRRVGELERRVEVLQAQQAQLVGEIEDRALATIDGLEGTVHATGLDLDELLRRMEGEQPGIGGPFVGLPHLENGTVPDGIGGSFAGPAAPGGFSNALDRLHARLTRWKVLHMALERVPLTPPVDHFHVSSSFGKRKDPFTGKWAIHSGLDMSGPRNTEIRATAPGTIVHAGWMGQYGRMVEIDHGFGLTTRYAHLRQVTVKVGQTVAFRDKIGIMGSTGRSTDRHVHYEVRFDGEPVDPAKFIEAGRHVFKN